MTVHDRIPGASTLNPGGATVADLRALPGNQALSVLLFRDSFEGVEGTARIRSTFAGGLGPVRGAATFEHWAGFLDSLMRHARRPVMRHGLSCRCVGADEAVIAQSLHLFGVGKREDATMTLALLVPGDRVCLAIPHAEATGRAILAVAHRQDWHRPPVPARHLH